MTEASNEPCGECKSLWQTGDLQTARECKLPGSACKLPGSAAMAWRWQADAAKAVDAAAA